MRLKFLGKGGSGAGGCPTLYATDRGSYLVQGWVTPEHGKVEIPHLLLGFAEPDTYVGARLTDTGRGTFTLTGHAVTEPGVVGQLTLADDETAIEVPKRERKFYGVTPGR
ncbi:hypothetical protein NONO_c48530 [Nocardia nova SH22a]|uniref:Uncharacterized protein n=1 Tax=Nocardia nova SH22a TaxID=1415166 RepID=W5TK77_9NOCA|nr:hypothetical protein [Nocardia nova]AHH19637.1 hypothetical protein NONO_c48530 [Nocardia nova SH22a]